MRRARKAAGPTPPVKDSKADAPYRPSPPRFPHATTAYPMFEAAWRSPRTQTPWKTPNRVMKPPPASAPATLSPMPMLVGTNPISKRERPWSTQKGLIMGPMANSPSLYERAKRTRGTARQVPTHVRNPAFQDRRGSGGGARPGAGGGAAGGGGR